MIAHQLERRDGRETYWPLIPELVEDPHEIWVGFVRHPDSGRVAVRRRYVKMLELARRRQVALVADTEKGFWQALTFFPSRRGDLGTMRWGLRLYRKG